MDEIWKDVSGYEGLYQVSNLGTIKSAENRSNHKKSIIMKQCDVCGYMCVVLTKNSKQKMLKVHRIVAEAFVENFFNKPQVNHIDGNKHNNNAENLEWVTTSENIRHAFNNGLNRPQKGKANRRSLPVEKLDLDGNVLDTYDGIREAERYTGIPHSNISNCCKGIYKTAGGYKWKMKNTRHGKLKEEH